MRMRLKIFILLLLFSLLPLFSSMLFVHLYTKERAQQFSSGVKNILRSTYEHELVTGSHDSSIILRKDYAYAEMVVRSLAFNVQHLIETKRTNTTEKTFHFIKQSDLPKTLNPPAKDATHDEATPITPSYEDIVYFLFEGNDSQAVQDTAFALHPLLPYFQSIILNPDNVAWRIYVSMENGVHASYPIQGFLPEGYTPKSRPWYKKALKHPGETVWTGPMQDASSNRIVFTCSQAVYDDNGNVLGVAAMDVLLQAVLSDNVANYASPKNLETYLISRDDSTEPKRYKILATRQYEDKITPWKEPLQLQYIPFASEEDQKYFNRALEVQHHGSITLPFRGQKCIWAFSKIPKHTYFLIILPINTVNTIIERPMNVLDSMLQTHRYQVGLALPIIILAAACIAFISSRRMSNQYQTMIDAWNKLAQGDFTTRLTMKTNDERDRLFEAFNDMVPKLEEHVAMRETLAVARDVQQELLPSTPPVLPGFDIAGASISCDETGGDYFDYFFRTNGHLALVVADVCGHGVPAALLMATLKGALRQRADQPGNPSSIITDVNNQIAAITSGSGRFLTAFYAEIDPETMTMTTVRAGHDPAFVFDSSTQTWSELKGKGIAVGAMTDITYTEEEHVLQPGQTILIGTDGIWEAKNEDGQLLGKGPIYEVIQNDRQETAATIIDHIFAAVHQHRGKSAPDDDVTMIVTRVLGTTV